MASKRKLKTAPAVRTAARVTIFEPGKMTPKGRRRIVEWLVQQAYWLENYGKKFTRKVVSASYHY